MQTKIFKTAVAVFAFTLLVACGPKIEPVTERDSSAAMAKIENLEVVNSAIDIQTVEGTPAEKVEIYTDKAKEAQTKLELLFESNLLEVPEENLETSFFDKIIPTAFAEDSNTTEEQIAELLVEIQIYTELAAEAATESIDPEEIVELLEYVQGIQVGTAETIEGAIVEVDEEIVEVLVEAAEEINESMEEIEDAVVEVGLAVASGEEEVSVEIETNVENFIFDGSQKINLREMMNPVVRAEKKMKRLEKTAEKVEEKLTAGEISEEEAAETLAKVQNQIGNSEEMQVLQVAFHEAKESGDEDAIGSAHEAIREFNRSVAIEKMEEFETKVLEKIESLPEEDQAEALEKHEERKEQQTVRRAERSEFIEKVNETKVELKEAREVGDEETIENLKEQVKEHHEEFQLEQEEKILEKIESLPEEDQAEALEKHEEQKKQREETAAIKQEALEKVEADRKILREAKEFGDEDAIEAAKETIEIHREEIKENLQKRMEVKTEPKDVSRELKNVIQEVKKEIKLPVSQNL